MELTLEKKSRKCLFCGSNKNEEVLFGPLYRIGSITTHYYCVLFSNKIIQRGSDNEGLLGFLPSDIKKELLRSKKIICCYCNKGHATLNCCHLKCKKKYHYLCAHKNGGLFQFFGQFKNYCSGHKPQQIIPKEILSHFKKKSVICSICHSDISLNNLNQVLWAPCCRKAWFHRLCVQKLALSAGYLFKCAICNNSQKFRGCMLRLGIYIPDKDASWELVPNAFEELLFRYNRCDADECKCPDGRQKDLEDTMWEIVLCKSCGSQGMHIACGKLKFTDPEWNCELCNRILTEKKIPSKESINYNDLRIKKKGLEANFQPVPSSSNEIIKTNPHLNKQKKKRKVSDSLENSTIYKKRRYDLKRDSLEDEILDIETVDTLNNLGSKESAEELTFQSLASDEAEKNKFFDSINRPKKNTDVIVISSDSECDVVEVVDEDTSDDEIEIIQEVVRMRNDENVIVQLSTNDECLPLLQIVRKIQSISTSEQNLRV